MFTRPFAIAILASSAVLAADKPIAFNFDHDPHWDAVNNHITPNHIPTVTQDFGYAPTNFAAQPPGKTGGPVPPPPKPCPYAPPTPKPLSPNAPPSASGTFAFTASTPGSGLFFGFLNSDQP